MSKQLQVPVGALPSSASALPYLEHHAGEGSGSHRIVLERFPFKIGRCETASWVLRTPKVSREHTEIFLSEGRLYLRDLGSRNGTFLNGTRIAGQQRPLDRRRHHPRRPPRIPFRLSAARRRGPTTASSVGPEFITDPLTCQVHTSILRSAEWLSEMIAKAQVHTVFQPIVDLRDKKTLGYEALGRGNHKELKPHPLALFRLAEKCGQAVPLSQTFRKVAVSQANGLPEGSALFCNIHPEEIKQKDLLDQLVACQRQLGKHARMVLEVHEDAITDLGRLRRLRAALKANQIELAFDDYGVGQSRLLELVDSPPDYVKLDMSLIRNIHAQASRQDIVRSVAELIRHRGIKLIAEGIETVEEAQVCHNLGCQFGQGYLFGRPAPI